MLSTPATLFLTLGLLSGSMQSPRPAMCVIDMGSNTFRRIAATFENGRYVQHAFERRTLGVGDDVAKHGRISDAKLLEIDQALAAFAATCRKEGATRVAAVGTAAFREAPNGRRVVEAAKTHGIAMEIASETRESELAYLAGSLGQDGFAVIDNGSRSIELVARQGGSSPHAVFNLGYRVAYDRFFAKAATAAPGVTAFTGELSAQASKSGFMKGRKKLVGVEYGEMAEILFPGGTVEGRVFTVAELKKRLQQIVAMPAAGFAALKKKEDIDRALPRLVSAVVLTEAFGYSGIELTERELGTGLIIEAGLGAR